MIATHAINRAERGKLVGMELAALRKQRQIKAAQFAFLDAIITSPDGTATIDDATDQLGASFSDGGKWRGTVTRALALERLIRKVGVEPSSRPSRHRGYLIRWEGLNAAAIDAKRDELLRWLADHPPDHDNANGCHCSLFDPPSTPSEKIGPAAATDGPSEKVEV